MKLFLIAFTAFILSCFSCFGIAQEVDHFEGIPSPTLEAALANLAEFNAELEGVNWTRVIKPRGSSSNTRADIYTGKRHEET